MSSSPLPLSLLHDNLTASISPIPLPFGKVDDRLIVPDEKLLFHVELPTHHSLLTVEIECKMGGVEVLICKNVYPTLNRYDYRGHCPMPSPSDSKVLRITFPLEIDFQKSNPHTSAPFFILILGDSGGAHFAIWTKASYPSVERIDVFSKVTSLQLLSEYGPKNLIQNFRRLHSETINAVSRQSTPMEILRSSSNKSLAAEQMDCTSDSDDDASMFLRKSGVSALKGELSSDTEGVDPNLSVGLFNRDPQKFKERSSFEIFSRETGSFQMTESSGDLAKLLNSLRGSYAYKKAIHSHTPLSVQSRSSAGAAKKKVHRLEPLKYTLTVPSRGPHRHKKDFV